MKLNQNLEVLQLIDKANKGLIVVKIFLKLIRLPSIEKKEVIKDLLI